MEARAISIGKIIAIIIGAVSFALLVYMVTAWAERTQQPAPATEPTSLEAPSMNNDELETDTAEPKNTITFTDDGYRSERYEVAPGATVTVRNMSSGRMEFSSDDHPTHTNETSLNTAVTRAGESTTFVAPTEPGEYGFHDHINARYTGTLVVVEQ